MHIIATMRAKQEYAVDKDSSGKTSVKKLGLEPEQRKGMEYEFTCFFEVDAGHTAFGAKDRTSIFDQQSFKITPSVGEKIMEWLQTGVDTAPVVVATSTSTLETAHADDELSKLKASVVALAKEIGATPEVKELLKSYEPSGNPNKLMDAGKLKELETALIDMKNVPSAVAEVA
jgi:hypothetical protein